jgi:hypothetical protein
VTRAAARLGGAAPSDQGIWQQVGSRRQHRDPVALFHRRPRLVASGVPAPTEIDKRAFHVDPVQEGQAAAQQQVLKLLWFDGIIETEAAGALGSSDRLASNLPAPP